MPKKVLFLDAFGTLLSGGIESIILACEEIVENNSLDMTPNEFLIAWDGHYKQILGGEFMTLVQANEVSLKRTYKELGIEDDTDGYLNKMYKSWYHAKLYDDASKGLQKLQSVPKCMVSNADEHLLNVAMKKNQLDFEYTVSSEKARGYKPYPRIFQCALEEVGCEPEEAIMVGDSQTSDIVGARRMGIPVIWINRFDEERREGVPEPDFEAKDILEMTEVLSDNGLFQIEV
jgi:2-haloalkanoic acid dehalogenase type II